MRVEILTVTPPNEIPNRQLDFNAQSVLIENPTAAYWELPDQQRFIPPFVSGMILSLGGISNAKIRYNAPPGLQQPLAFSLSAAARFLYTDEKHGSDSGLSLSANAFGRSLTVIPVSFTTPQTLFTFVQPAPDGFTIIPQTGAAGTMNNLLVSVDYGGTGAFFKREWARAFYTPNSLGFSQNMQIRVKRFIPAQSVLAMSCSAGGPLPALLVI